MPLACGLSRQYPTGVQPIPQSAGRRIFPNPLARNAGDDLPPPIGAAQTPTGAVRKWPAALRDGVAFSELPRYMTVTLS
jgi:hypothetical protein